MCRKGEIRVDGGRVTAATRLERRAGGAAAADPRGGGAGGRRRRRRSSQADAAMIRACVIWKDDDIIALNKPPGLAVQGGTGAGPACRRARRGAALRPAGQAAAGAPAGPRHLRRAAAGAERARRRRGSPRRSRRARRARSTGRRWPGAPSPRAGTIRTGLVKAPGHGAGGEGEKMVVVPPDRSRRDRGGEAGDDRLCR